MKIVTPTPSDEPDPSDDASDLFGNLMPSGRSPKKARAAKTGSRIAGMFELGARVGEGAFGEVYQASQFAPNRRKKVAIKILKRGLGSKEVLKRFARESQALTDLNHPAIPRIIHAGRTRSGQPFIAMEWVDGLNLAEWCRIHQDDWRLIVEVFIQICEALAYVHSKNIVHRDLKPSNIFVAMDESGRPVVKIIDFGIAKAMCQDIIEDAEKTAAGTLLGTPEYMGPEQIAGRIEEIDRRSDLYALGAVFYESVSKNPPLVLPPGSSREQWRKLIETAIPGPASQVPGARYFPQEIDTILAMALAKCPNARYANALAFAADLRTVLTGKKSTARRHQIRTAANRWIALTAGVGLMAVTVAAAIPVAKPHRTLGWIAEFIYEGREPAIVRAPQVAPVEAAFMDEPRDVQRLAEALTSVRIGSGTPAQRMLDVQAARDIARPYIDQSTPSPLWKQHWIEIKRWEGARLIESGKPDEAEVALKEGLTTLRYFKTGSSMTPALMEKEALICHELAAVYRARKQCNGDIGWRRKELAIYEKLTDLEDPQRVAGQRYTCASLRFQLAVLLQKRAPEEAAALIEGAMLGHKAAYESPPASEQIHQVASRYCTTLEKRMELAIARQDRVTHSESLREIIRLGEECFAQSLGAEWGRLAAKSRAALARILETGGDAEGAQAQYLAAVELGRRVQPHLNRPDFSRDLESWTRKLLP